MKALSTNKLANHSAFPKIIEQYNLLLQKGKVNNFKFWREVILPEIPDYKMQSWYQFLKRFKTSQGIVPVEISPVIQSPLAEGSAALENTAKIMLSNDSATQKLISNLLNISAQAAEGILSNPASVSSDTWKKIEMGLKAMKSQDSRIHAIGKLREDKREQDKFDRAFEGASV